MNSLLKQQSKGLSSSAQCVPAAAACIESFIRAAWGPNSKPHGRIDHNMFELLSKFSRGAVAEAAVVDCSSCAAAWPAPCSGSHQQTPTLGGGVVLFSRMTASIA